MPSTPPDTTDTYTSKERHYQQLYKRYGSRWDPAIALSRSIPRADLAEFFDIDWDNI